METVKLIQSIEEFGCFLKGRNGKVLIFNSNSLPAAYKEKIRNSKYQLLEVLERDEKAKIACFMIGISGQLYTQTVNNHSAVYIEMIGSEWQAWRETYQSTKEKAVSIKVIATGENFDYVLLQARDYFDNLNSLFHK